MIGLDDIIVGREVEILHGRHKGERGIIVDFQFEDSGELEDDQLDIQIKGTDVVIYLGREDVSLIDPYQSFWKNAKETHAYKVKENKINPSNMKKLVFESLNELLEAKKEVEKEDKPSMRNVAAEKAKLEKTKATKIKMEKKEKILQAIKALEEQKKKAQKPGSMRQTPSQKKANIDAIQKKIDAWKAKLKEL
jgi:hypothetical protein